MSAKEKSLNFSMKSFLSYLSITQNMLVAVSDIKFQTRL